LSASGATIGVLEAVLVLGDLGAGVGLAEDAVAVEIALALVVDLETGVEVGRGAERHVGLGGRADEARAEIDADVEDGRDVPLDRRADVGEPRGALPIAVDAAGESDERAHPLVAVLEVVLQLEPWIVRFEMTGVRWLGHVRFRAAGLHLESPDVGELPCRVQAQHPRGADRVLVEGLLVATLDAEIELGRVLCACAQRRHQRQQQHGDDSSLSTRCKPIGG
jgi:hypothetical protein